MHSCPDCELFAIRLLQVLTGSQDRRTAIKAECYLAVINDEFESQSVIARKYGVTRAAISKFIVQIKDELGISGRYGKDKLTYRERLARLKERL